MRLISSLILIFLMIGIHGPNTPQRSEPVSAVQGDTKNNQEFPVIYGKKGDGFPDKVNLRGAIAKVSFARDCGFWRSGGVLQIKVARAAPGYNSEYIYVAAPCLLGWEGDEQYAGRVVCMNVKKMRLGDMCNSDYIINSIDSKGTPFYCLSWQSGKYKEFLKQVDCKD
jgi:hypothetical protein